MKSVIPIIIIASLGIFAGAMYYRNRRNSQLFEGAGSIIGSIVGQLNKSKA